MVLRWLIFPICYLLGSLSPSYLVVSRTRHVDLRRVGIGHLGTTGAYMAGGAACGLVALAGDVGKGVLAAWLGLRMFGPGPAAMLSAVAVVLGHNFSVFYGFRGGKGFATTGGALLLLAPRVLLPAVVAGLVATAVTESFRTPDVRDMLTGLVMVAAIPSTVNLLLPGAYLLPAVLLTLVMLASFRRNLPQAWQGAKAKEVRWHQARVLWTAAICIACFALLAWQSGLAAAAAVVAAAGQWAACGMLLLALLSGLSREWRLLASFAGGAALAYCLAAVIALVSGRAVIELLIPLRVTGWPGEALAVPAWEGIAIHHLLSGLALAAGGLSGRLCAAREQTRRAPAA